MTWLLGGGLKENLLQGVLERLTLKRQCLSENFGM